MPHETLRLYISPDAYIIEPSFLDPTVLSENLVLNRESGILRRNVPALPSSYGQEQVMTIYGIFGFLRLYSGDHLIVITNRVRVGKLQGVDVWRMSSAKVLPIVRNGARHLPEAQQAQEAEYLDAIVQVLHSDNFYFTYGGVDLTRRAGSFPILDNTRALWKQVDPRFHFNRFLQQKLMDPSSRDGEQNMDNFILPVMSGFVEIRSLSDPSVFTFALISRRGVGRVGTRYFSRGVDLQGNVSNFVETEQLLVVGDRNYSHVQVRGSIPLFWRQVINVKYQPALQLLSHPYTNEAFAKHFADLQGIYGSVLAFNLVNSKGYEFLVGDAFTRQVQLAENPGIAYTHFDFHHECRKMQWQNISKLLVQFESELEQQGYTVVVGSGAKVERKQTSVVRTNCMDCLDRTNVVQSEIAKWVLAKQMRQAGILGTKSIGGDSVESLDTFYPVFRNVWADNADAVSKQYSGTGALKTDFTRTGKRTKAGALQDGWNSAVRYVKNNFLDGPRQDALDLLVGQAEISSPRASVAQRERSTRFFVLCMVMAFSVVALLWSLVFGWGVLYLGFYWTLLVLCIRQAMQFGDEFVVLPTLNPPYADASPVVVRVPTESHLVQKPHNIKVA